MTLPSDGNKGRRISKSEVAGKEVVANFAQNVEIPEIDDSDLLSKNCEISCSKVKHMAELRQRRTGATQWKDVICVLYSSRSGVIVQ